VQAARRLRPRSRAAATRRSPGRVRELIEKHEADADPLNVLPELAAARALFEDFVERYDTWRDALLAWHRSYTSRTSLPAEQAEAFRRCLDEYEIRLGEIGEDASEKQLEDAKLAREFIKGWRLATKASRVRCSIFPTR
jgi:hypothetical protein